MVHFREYNESLDMLGKDLISMLARSREHASKLVGNIVDKSEMRMEELPGEYVTATTGEVADEVHEWPNASLGTEFHHLVLKFGEGRLVEFVWKFQHAAVPRSKPALPRQNAWWRFW